MKTSEQDYAVINKPVLTLYHTIPTLNDPDKVAFCKHCGKKTKR